MRNRPPNTFLEGEDEDLYDPDSYVSGIEGERRLWYVALTRCSKFLNVTGIDREGRNPTDFYTEIGHNYVQREGPIDDRPAGTPVPPANADLLPTTYSDLETFWRCQFEYLLRGIMDYSPGVKEAYGYGQQIHNALAEIHQQAMDGEPMTKDEARELVRERFHLRYTSGEPLEELKRAAMDSVERYLEEYPDSAEFVFRAEQSFEFTDEESGALISGTIDLLERVDDSENGETKPVAVVDFKTHSWDSIESYEAQREAVDNQLRLYSIAASEAFGFHANEARAHILSPSGPPEELEEQGVDEVIDVDISKDRLEEMMARVRRSIEEIEMSVRNEDFAFDGVENAHCPECDFKSFCPGYVQFQRRV